ncbi:flagellar hook-length control protein FliK [Alteromonas gracilis]|uniref:flagellar hook-length control protein FliK n=1 Tax=Alteromonas gracilis TaxID=1479524 RepID=UPI0037352A9E
MTTPLSSLLANVSGQSSGSAPPSSTAQASSNTTNATLGTNAPQTITNAALSKATSIDNAAKVAVKREPERVLSISTVEGSSSKPSQAQTISVNLPAEVNNKLAKQPIQNAQLVLLPEAQVSTSKASELNAAGTNAQSSSNSPSAVLLSTQLSQQNVSLSAQDKADLLKAVAQTLAANNAAVSLKGQLSISTKSESFGQLMLTTSKNEVVPLTGINTEKLDSSARSALQKLVGQQVILNLSRAGSGSITLQISQIHTNTDNAASINSSVKSSAQNTISFVAHKNVSTNLQQNLIDSALKQGGVAIEHKPSNPAGLNNLIANFGATTNTMKALSALTLIDSTLSIRSAQQNAIMQISVPQGTGSSLSIPTLTLDQISNLNLSQLPQVTAKGIETSAASNISNKSPTIANLQAENPTALKGTDVHNAITALSRVLLSQTGSTSQALSQLIAIVENGKLQPDAALSNAQGNQHFDKIMQHLKGLDALSAKASQISQSKADFIGPPKPTNEQVLLMQKHASLQGKEANQSEAASTQQVPVKDSVVKPSIASVAQALSAQAKSFSGGLLNSALGSIIQQLSAAQNKGADAPVSTTSPISDTLSTISDSKLAQGLAGETLLAGEEVKSGFKKIGLDLNEQGLSQRLQQLISTHALVTTPINLTSPVNSSSFVQGLVALLQLALAGRAMQRQPNIKTQIDAPDSIVSKTLTNMGVSTQPSRVSQDINQLDSRQQLISQLKTLLSNHQQNKIANVDSRIQGQDSFYYILPSLYQHQSPPELLIKREHSGPNNKQSHDGKRSLWNITMKLDIGDRGQVLAKSKIDKSTITLDLYASNDEVLRRIGDTLPYLQKRLTSLGLVIESSSYQRGQIPDTLNIRPHQIFETRV